MSGLTLPSTHRDALLANPWFAALPERVRNAVLARGRRRALAAGELAFARGSASDGLYAVLEGMLRLGGVDSAGRETILDFYGPGAWIGEVSTFDGSTRSHNAVAVGATQLLHIGLADVEALLAEHAPFGRALLSLQAKRLRILLVALESYSTQSIPQRLANRLLMLAEHHGTPNAHGLALRLPLSQDTLARLIGSTRQRVNQIVKDWERRGLVRVETYGRIVLLDAERLRDLGRP